MGGAGADIEVILYVRPNCSLCEAADALLVHAAQARGIRVRRVDVESDPALEAEYGERIPVAVAPSGVELFEFAVDATVLPALLDSL